MPQETAEAGGGGQVGNSSLHYLTLRSFVAWLLVWYHHGITTASHGVACHGWYHVNSRGDRQGTPWKPYGMSWQPPRHPNAHGTQVRVAVRVGVEVRGRLRGMPWKML